MKKKFPVTVLILLIAIIASQMFMSLLLLKYNRICGVAGLCTSLALTAATAVIFWIYSRNPLRHIAKMNAHLENSAAEYMNTLPAPIAVFGDSEEILWYNRSFLELISGGTDAYGISFEKFTGLNIKKLKSPDSSVCTVNGLSYRIMYEEFTENDITFTIAYFKDETEKFRLKRVLDETHPNVVIMNIDTYDEIMQNAKESEKALASVEIEKLMEIFMEGTDGFIKKVSSNTFYAIIEKKHLDEKINGRFKILDLAREIKIAGKYTLTLSIGIGDGAESLAESEKIARQCLDMALGRGGDQAVIKTENGFRFFGGLSKGVETMSRTRARVIANAMQDIIMSSDTVYIMGHRFGDLDSVGASCGLAGALKLLNKKVHIVVDRTKNLAVNLIENVEKQAEQELFISPSKAVQDVTENDLLIIVDTHNPDIIESRELYDACRQVVVIDHHRKTVNFINNSVIFYHEPNASSASEMVTEIIQYLRFSGDKKIPSYCAEALLAGIMLDTKNFVMRTGVRTFEAAAFLRKLGADTVSVKLLFSNSFDSYKRKSSIVSAAQIHKNCAVSAADFQSDDIRIVAPQAADELLSIEGVEASFAVYRTGDIVNISARSLGAVNVQVIMELLGGGGHQTMAAAQIKDKTVEEAVNELIQAIDSREQEIN
ncbi:MAG: DHH family phosphoesterase [Ruminococcus sp.]|nr:DHH family phosphoesterase [Ruminococcus sp.]